MTTSSDPVIPVASSASVWNQATPGPSPEASPVKDSAAGRLGKDSHQAIPAPKTAAAAGRGPRKTPAHGPSASEITVPGPPSVQQARAGTEPGRYDHGLFLPTPRSRADSCVGFTAAFAMCGYCASKKTTVTLSPVPTLLHRPSADALASSARGRRPVAADAALFAAVLDPSMLETWSLARPACSGTASIGPVWRGRRLGGGRRRNAGSCEYTY